MYIDYVNYLLSIKNSLIQCGIEIDKPLSLESDYADVVSMESVLSDVVYFFKIMSITNSPIALQGFFLPLDELYSSKIRKETYLEFVNLVLPNYKKLVGDSGSSPYYEENFSDLGDDILDSMFEDEPLEQGEIEYSENGLYLEDLLGASDFEESSWGEEEDFDDVENVQQDVSSEDLSESDSFPWEEESFWEEENIPLEDEESSWSEETDDGFSWNNEEDSIDESYEESPWADEDEEYKETSWGDEDEESPWEDEDEESSWGDEDDGDVEYSSGVDSEESSWGDDEEEFEESPYEDDEEEFEESSWGDDEEEFEESPYEDEYEESSWGDDEEEELPSPRGNSQELPSNNGDAGYNRNTANNDKDLGTVLQDKTNAALTSIKRGIGNLLYKK